MGDSYISGKNISSSNLIKKISSENIFILDFIFAHFEGKFCNFVRLLFNTMNCLPVLSLKIELFYSTAFRERREKRGNY